ncbi:hypothetical protein [Streptomyces poonensis]|nr:hypothetical protein [Streptomyces poonensis]
MTAAVTVLAGCQQPSGASGVSGVSGTGLEPGKAAATAAPPPAYDYEPVFLGVDECSSFGTTSFTEVSCASERAAARVVARHDGKVSEGPPCPATTDFVLHISAPGPTRDEDGDGRITQGYACMRKLQEPHPGDPGGGGGPRTIVGDCVYSAGEGEVRETACDGKGRHAPEYRVTQAVKKRSGCPDATVLYVGLGGSEPVGCARPV